MTEMPSYFRQVLGVDIKANGVMSAIPYLVLSVTSFPFTFMADLILRKKWLSITVTRKLSNSIGHYGPALALIGLSYAPAGDVGAAVVLLSAVVGLNAGACTGYLLVHIDMAPNFAGTLMGITNCLANITSIIVPLVASAILKDETDAGDWRKVFYLSSVMYIVCNTFFVIFGSCNVQKWNQVSDNSDNTNDTTEKKVEKVV